MKAIIAGAGVAGSVTALALHKAGIQAVVLERYPRPDAEVGSWLTISPNGLDALATVEALPVAKEIGVSTTANILKSSTGRELGRTGLGAPLSDGTPALTVKRSRLTLGLLEECRRRGIEIHHRSEVVDVRDDGHHVRVQCGDGSSHDADLLIGADGVRSVTRNLVDPDAPAARYVGLTNFGGFTPGAAELIDEAEREPKAWHMIFGRSAFFGHLMLPSGDAVWFVNEPRPAISADERASTSHRAWLTHLAGLFDRDAGPAARLIRAGDLELAADNTYDLGVVPNWHRGRTIVIGDAAHAPSPSSGQGASMACEDAVVLAQALRDSPDVSTAFTAFEAKRRSRVERIVAIGARSSSSKAPGPMGRVIRDALMPFVFRHVVTDRKTAWMFDHRVSWDSPVSA